MNIPANQTMRYYFDRNKSDKNFREKERTTLPRTLSKDLDKLQKYENHDHTYCSRLSLRNQQNLEKLRTTTQNRVEWRNLINKMVHAAEAEGAYAPPAIQQ